MSNIFGGFYTFARDYFDLSFNNYTHVIMSIGSDIYVFICMGFALVKLFDEWVYGFW